MILWSLGLNILLFGQVVHRHVVPVFSEEVDGAVLKSAKKYLDGLENVVWEHLFDFFEKVFVHVVAVSGVMLCFFYDLFYDVVFQ